MSRHSYSLTGACCLGLALGLLFMLIVCLMGCAMPTASKYERTIRQERQDEGVTQADEFYSPRDDPAAYWADVIEGRQQ